MKSSAAGAQSSFPWQPQIQTQTNMAICEVYSQTVTFKYKSTLCSKSTVFSIVSTILSFLLPLLVAYRSHGFWLKNSEYREQPDIHFKYDYVMYMETDQPDQPILCSTLPYTREFAHCSVVKSREEDNDLDGKFDELIFEISVDVPENLAVYSVQLILLFDYVLQKKCLLQMESLALIQYNSGLPGFRLDFIGDLKLVQKQLLSTRGGTDNTDEIRPMRDTTITALQQITQLLMESLALVQYNSGLPGFRFDFIGDLKLVQKQLLSTRGRDLRYNQPIFSTDEESIAELNLNQIIAGYARRNISTKLENTYQMWASGILLDEPFRLKVNINYPEENIKYKPSFWQRIKGYVFQNHIIPTIREAPWSKKLM